MSDPTRLSDSRSNSSELLRRLVRAGQSEVPEAQRLRQLADRLGLKLGAAAAASGAAKGAAGLAIGATKIGAVTVLVLGTGAAAMAIHHLAKAPPEVVSTPSVEDDTTPLRPASSVVTAALSREEPPPATAPPSPLPSVQVPQGSVSSARRPREGLNDSVQVASTAAPADSLPVDTELSLLEQAQRVLRSDPGRALGLANRDARIYPMGALAQEREVIAIEALAQLGRHSEASARAARFFQTFPGSAHGTRVRSIVDFDADAHNP